MIKSFNPIKSRRPLPPILILHLFQQGPFSSWPLLFLHLECFCLDFTSFFLKTNCTILSVVNFSVASSTSFE